MAQLTLQNGKQISFPDGLQPEQVKKIVAAASAAPADAPVPWYTPITYAPKNAWDVASGLYDAVRHPLDTANGLASLGNGAIANIPGVTAANDWAVSHGLSPAYDKTREASDQQLAGNVGQQIKDNFSSPTRAWNTIATHPVDTLLTAAPVVGQVGKVADAIGLAKTASALAKASEVINPINMLTKPVGMLAESTPGKFIGSSAREALALPAGVGGDALGQAYEAGKEGGDSGQLFRDNMRGNVPQTAVLQDVQDALGKMKSNASTAYKTGMAATKANSATLDYAPIDKAMSDLTDTLYHGPVSTTDKASLNLAQDVRSAIDEWKQAYPNPTPADMDRLKVKIDNLKPNFTQNSGDQQRIVSTMRNAVKDQILAADPTYAKTMKDYETFKDAQDQIQRSLSAGPNANNDTTLRKLQSVFRNNVNTNYGSRADSVQALQDIGGKDIMSQLAGQQLNSLMPRGLSKLVAAAIAGSAWANPAHVLALPFTSPRVLGEVSHAMGRTAGGVGRVAKKVPQVSAQDMVKALLAGRASTAYGAIPR